ncbi:hypothetical protein JXJ21_19750 [candidate division KSB1 bacterium]|nr:hypothetical protein [candidate division KSB1 bacterium]
MKHQVNRSIAAGIIAVIVFIALPISIAFSQTSISVLQFLGYNSNSFYNYRQLSDVDDYIGLKVKRIIEGEKIQSQLFYNGDLNFYKSYSERLYHNQMMGYDGYIASGNNKKIVYFGANWLWHDGRDIYNVYDFWKVTGYANLKKYFRSNLIGFFGYQLNNRNYAELEEFSYWEHYFFTRLNTFFQTRTSITLDINYGLKDYIPLQISSGRGRRVAAEFVEMPGVDQLVTSIKVAQSIGEKNAINAKYLNRLNPGLVAGSASVMNSDELFTEDELFDDRYGYRGHEFSLGYTQYLPAYIKLELGWHYYLKSYLNRQIYDLEGNVSLSGDFREDTRRLFWAGLSRSFGINRGMKTVKVSLEGGYLKNESNDSYYHYDNLWISSGLEFRIK